MSARRRVGFLAPAPALALALAAILHLGCGEDVRPKPSSEAVMIGYSAGDSCLSGTVRDTAGNEEGGGAKVEVTVSGLTIFVTHKNAVFNCCMDSIEVGFSQDGWRLMLEESEVVTHACRCLCEFEVSATIEVPAPGTYMLEIWTAEALVWGDEVEV